MFVVGRNLLDFLKDCFNTPYERFSAVECGKDS